MKRETFNEIWEFMILTISTIVQAAGVYVFRFPNNFSFGGTTGLAVILATVTPISPAGLATIMNVVLIVVGFLMVGKSFGAKTIYVSVLFSAVLIGMEVLFPMQAPITSDPLLNLIYAIVLTAFSSALLFYFGASSGGTDIIAMIIKEHTSFNISTALLVVDIVICGLCFLVFDITTALYSMCGFLAKVFLMDNFIMSFSLNKCFTIVCSRPQAICDFINNDIKRSATIYHAEGAYTHEEKTVILTVLSRNQAAKLRSFIRQNEPSAFMLITNSSEIVGNGFKSSI